MFLCLLFKSHRLATSICICGLNLCLSLQFLCFILFFFYFLLPVLRRGVLLIVGCELLCTVCRECGYLRVRTWRSRWLSRRCRRAQRRHRTRSCWRRREWWRRSFTRAASASSPSAWPLRYCCCCCCCVAAAESLVSTYADRALTLSVPLQ